ncbi:hypothetical protein HHI36_007794, partial [Cryptolaemus montrouzieri]
MSKNLEEVLRRQLVQLGFRSDRSTTPALVNLIDGVDEALDGYEYAEVLALSKAFYSVIRDLLFRIMEFY